MTDLKLSYLYSGFQINALKQDSMPPEIKLPPIIKRPFYQPALEKLFRFLQRFLFFLRSLWFNMLIRPWLASTIRWTDPSGVTRSYRQFTTAELTRINEFYQLIRSGRSTGLPEAPPIAYTPLNPDNLFPHTYLSETIAKDYFLAQVAQSLVVEFTAIVPWTISTYSPEQLSMLFSSDRYMDWVPEKNAYSINGDAIGWITPGCPYRVFRFLEENIVINGNRRQTIAALLLWCRRLYHFVGGMNYTNALSTWQYAGMPPVERVINGTVSPPHTETYYWTAGCHGTAGFLHMVLRTVNIPVERVIAVGHALPHFMTENLYLSHGDDPYSALVKSPLTSGDDLLINQATFDEWFGPTAAESDKTKNVGRKPIELGVRNLPNYLLYKYCRDQAAGHTHAHGEVASILQDAFTVAQLEAANLWERMDAAIDAAGGCSNIPYS
jgi:hypothetical protein